MDQMGSLLLEWGSSWDKTIRRVSGKKLVD